MEFLNPSGKMVRYCSINSVMIGGVVLLKEFCGLQDMKQFAKLISTELEQNNRADLALETSGFSYNSYTTSSEYLGEFRLVLKKILKEKDFTLDNKIRQSIYKAIAAIDKAFGNT